MPSVYTLDNAAPTDSLENGIYCLKGCHILHVYCLSAVVLVDHKCGCLMSCVFILTAIKRK